MKKAINYHRLVFLSLLLVFFPGTYALASNIGANTQMKEWVDWVLHNNKTYGCPAEFSNSQKKECAWPSRLSLSLTEKKGTFKQSWTIQRKSTILLPGNLKYWPQNVTVNNKPAVVIQINQFPSITLEKGSYSISGEFSWSSLPDVLQIPVNTGLVDISVNNKEIIRPDIKENGEVWLKQTGKEKGKGETDTLEIKTFRRVIDDIPMQLDTVLQINVSGKSREEFLQPLLPDLIPMQLTSPLPARIEKDGRLRVQVRPGQWTIHMLGRYPAQVSQLTLPEKNPAELWAFDARNEFRVVEVKGVLSVDPRQTTVPQEWQKLPVYQVKPNETITFSEIRRGDPEPQPDNLTLQRDIWLDFDGNGYNFKDTIHGTMTREWRLDAAAGIQLGNVSIDGNPQFITHLPGNNKIQGIEVRRGHLNIEAESRYTKKRGELPVTGWDKDFSNVKATLHIPPGYKVFSIFGIDNDPRTWVQRWTLLDLFLVLVITISIMRLYKWPWAVLALFTMAITWHQSGAPQAIWFSIILGAALHKVISQEKFRQRINIFLIINFVILFLISIPFAVHQIRVAIYPQLEYQWQHIQSATQRYAVDAENTLGNAMPEKAESMLSKPREKFKGIVSLQSAPAMARKAQKELYEIDPKANIQTGYGTPQWDWQSIPLRWNGPVEKSQLISITYLSPWINRILGFLRVGMLIALALFLIKQSGVLNFNFKNLSIKGTNATLLLSFIFIPVILMSTSSPASASDFPSQELLEELNQRLNEPPDCKNHCADISRISIEIDENKLLLRLEVQAENSTSIPLPSQQKYWVPTVVLVDGKVTPPMKSKNGQLWAVIDRGVHQVILSGKIGPLSQFQLPLSLKPHYGSSKVKGWVLDGLHKDGHLDRTLQFSRKASEGDKLSISLEPSEIPAFLRVERTLQLGLDWTVTTNVYRVNNTQSAVVVEVPLLDGESVTTNKVRVKNRKVQINLPPNINRYSWTSTLKKSNTLKLKSASNSTFTEVWRAYFSPVWHVETKGIPVIHHVQNTGTWLPQWYPWPGEEVEMDISKPIGVEGPTVTIDQTKRIIKPGQRVTDTDLSMSIRSSKGTQHPVKLPEGSSLQSVTIDGRTQPIRQSGRMVNIPLHPGSQNIKIVWRENSGIQNIFSPSKVDISIPSINHSTKIQLGRDRWVLFLRGPVMGPAVLIWGIILVVLMIAYALGKLSITPLKSWQWALLVVGLTQVSLWVGVGIVGWLLALGVRGRINNFSDSSRFNLMQVGLAIWSAFALVSLYMAVSHGLLGFPDMQVTGNFSNAYDLNWFQDRSASILPGMSVISVSLMTYRLVMLAWALWLAFSLVKWIRWGWSCASHNGLWQQDKEKNKPEKDITRE